MSATKARMKPKPHDRVSIEAAEIRAMRALMLTPVPASYVADHIWPNHRMKPQGAGAAASRVLRRLEKRGAARWTMDGGRWGWIMTTNQQTTSP